MSYFPESKAPTSTLKLLAAFVYEQLLNVSASFSDVQMKTLPELQVAPGKVKEGLLVFADGTNWDPGSGKGVYIYYNATWNKLG